MSFDRFEQRLNDLDRRSRRRRLIPRVSARLKLDDRGRSVVNFGSNDYLGFAAEPTETFDKVPRRGTGASALVSGWTDRHAVLADAIARLEQTEAAVVFPSGYAACSGVTATLGGTGDVILSDELNHASIIDGCRLSRAQTIVYPHRDHTWVDRFLAQRRDEFDQAWIVTDGVFSMDGSVAPLPELCDAASRHDARLIVDEAHATGVLGNGRGVCHAMEVSDRVAVRIGTLSKAIGAQGGFACGNQVVVDYLVNFCRTLIFSTSLAPAAIESAIESLDSIANDPSPRQRVTQMAVSFRQQISDLTRMDTGTTGSAIADHWERQVPIIPIVLGDDSAAVAMSESLWERGFYVPAIRPPTVPENTARLRVSLSAAHRDEDVSGLVQALRQSMGDTASSADPA